MKLKQLTESRTKALDEVQNHNDNVGTKFKDSIEKHTEDYMQGIIHHVEYVEQIKLCCTQAEDHLLPLPKLMELS